MKKILLYALMTVVAMTAFSLDADAQYKIRGKKKKKKKKKTEQKGKKKKDYFDDSGTIIPKLWYGASGQLGLVSNTQTSQTQFGIGITPMVGYKITDKFSAGPKVGVNYTFFSDGFYKANLTDFSAGVFTRFKIFRGIFAHAELEYENEEVPTGANATEILTERESSNNGFLGLGWNQGNGALGYEIYVLYNFLEEEDVNSFSIPFVSITAPIVFRVGLTYKF